MNNTDKSGNENSAVSAGGSCEPGCKCNAPSTGSGRKLKNIILIVIVIAAIAVAARSFFHLSRNERQPESTQFAAVLPQNKTETSVNEKSMPDTIVDSRENGSVSPETAAPEKADWGEPLSSVTALNDVATDVDAVFILLSNELNKSLDPAVKEIESAATTIKARGIRIRSFYLKKEAPEYPTFSQQVSVPGVIVMAKGRGMNGVPAGQITADKLIQAFVAASQPASGCGPSCGPSSSGCK